MIFTPYILPLLVGAAILIWMVLYALRFKEVPTARIFSILIGLMALWALNQALEISTSWLDLKIFLTELRAPVNAFIPFVSLLLALTYTGHSQWLTRRRWGLFLIVPLVIALLSITSTYHLFFYYNFSLDTSGPFPILLKTNGVGYLVFILYSYFLLIITAGIFFAALRNPKLSLRNTLILLTSLIIPFFTELLDYLGFIPIRGYSLTPAMFVFPALLYGWAMLRNNLFSVIPVARSIVMEHITDLVIVLDVNDRIVDFNPAAQAVFGFTKESLGALTHFLPKEWADLFHCFQGVTAYQGEVSLGEGNEERFYDLSISTIQSENNQEAGRLFILHDLSRSKQAEENLRISEKRFRLLTDNAPLSVVVTTLEKGDILYGNQRLAELFETPLEKLLGSNVRVHYVEPQDIDRFINILLADNQVSDFQARMKKGDGREFWVSITANISIFDGIPAIHATCVDISESRRAEQELRASEERFRKLFEQAAVAVELTDTISGRSVRINQKTCDLFGYTEAELLELPFMAITHPEDIAMNVENNKLLMAGKIKEYTIEKRYIRKDGQIIWCKLTVSPLWSPGETPPVYLHIAVMEDISERKRAEEELRQSEERFRLLAENAQDVIWTMDLTGHFTYVSPSVESLRGYTPAEVLQQTVEQALTPESAVIVLERMKEIFLTASAKQPIVPKKFELEQPCKDGTTVWTEVLASTLRDNSGNPSGFLGITRDISERRQMEQALRESEEKFRSLFEGHGAIMLLLDPDSGKIVDGNPSACQFYGYGRAELLAMNITEINCLSPEEVHTILKKVEMRQTNHLSFPHRLASGEIRSVEVDTSPVLMQGKQVLFSIIRDVTEQKKMEAELIESQKMVGIGTLAAGITHEINSPLQVITGYSESLLKELQEAAKLEGERPERQLKTINRNAWRVAEIVRSLQHYAHPKSDRASQTDLNDLVKDTLILIEHQLKSWSNIQIETHLAEALPPFICDQNKLIQVLINLLSNARDAMPNGGIIRIDTAHQAEQERLVLRIADNGAGIPEVIRGRIFDPFYTTKDVGKGTGLGLSIVQGIVRAHGGEIQVESVLKAGTTFTITLPLTPPVQKSGGDAENLTEEAARARYD